MVYKSETPPTPLPKCGIFEYHFEKNTKYDPKLPAYIDPVRHRVLTRGEVKDKALRLATGLRSLGVKRRDVATIWSANSLEWIMAAWGSLAAGVTVSPANAAFAPKEIAYQINNSKASLIFIEPELLAKLDEARPFLNRPIPDSRIILLVPKAEQPPVKRYKVLEELYGAPGKFESFSGDQVHDTTWLCYSSGTTGLPKGVMTTHYNFTSQVEALKPVAEPLGPNDCMLGFVPLSHIYGTTMVFQQPFSVGAAVVLLPRFDEKLFLSSVERYKIVHGLIVPPILIVLLHSKYGSDYDLSSLRTLMCAASPLGPDLLREFEARYPTCKITQGYGLTETSPIITCMTGAEAKGGKVDGSIGRLIPTFEARLVLDDGSDAPPGERGELWVRSPSVMKGYLDNPTATANTMDGEWFKTGDVLVRSEDGYYTVVDRVKELIKYKGFQVPPAELEALLLTHPQIKDVAVVGLYDKSQATELPTAYVMVTPDVDQSAAGRAAFDKDIQAWVAARAARHKRLGGGVHIVELVPKSPSGKILRRLLRDQGQAERDARHAAARL